MEKIIRFRGLGMSRDELATENGELSLCDGVELYDGALRASVLRGEEKINIGSGKTLLYVHKLTDPDISEVYVFTDGEKVWSKTVAKGAGTPDKEVCLLTQVGQKVVAVEAIGNTLVIIGGDKKKRYALWKRAENEYKFLGEKPPMVDIRFRLSKSEDVEYLDTDAVQITESVSGFKDKSSAAFAKLEVEPRYVIGSGDVDSIAEEYQGQVTDMVWALVNKANAAVAEHNRFYAPFFVRYCYRMFDGSMYMHSAPILMLTVGDSCNQVLCLNRQGGSFTNEGVARIPLWGSNDTHKISFNKFTAMYIPLNAKLEYTVNTDSTTLETLKLWKDVIASVDIFISQPINHYNTGALIKRMELEDTIENSDIYSANNRFENYTSFARKASDDSTMLLRSFVLPRLDEEKTGDYTNISTFFKAYSFSLDEIEWQTRYTELPMSEGVVKTIVGRERMTDDYKSHNKLLAEGEYTYNKRVNLYGLREQLFKGFNLANLSSVCVDNNPSYNVTDIRVKLETDEGTRVVGDVFGASISQKLVKLVPLFYPDARAVEMRLRCVLGEEDEKTIVLKMKPATELNGAWTDVFAVQQEDGNTMPELTDDVLMMKSKIYTSEVNNPFYFPLNGINTVGVGEIRGLAATTRALSQGQFGQYPLLAFSTDGIWALSVSSTGTYSSIHPLSREVCENSDSIVQLDQSVLFATVRGVNRIVESDIALLSKMLDGPYDYMVKVIAEDLLKGEYNRLLEEPHKFFITSKAIYDFSNSRVLFFSKDPEKADIVMVLSLHDGTWSIMDVGVWTSVINGYPYAYIQYEDGIVEELNREYDYDDQETYQGILVSRSMKFEGLKSFIQGWEHFTTGTSVKMVFYGSDSLKEGWKRIGGSERMYADNVTGYPFKYFKVGILMDMKTEDKYSHLMLDVKEKYSHQ